MYLFKPINWVKIKIWFLEFLLLEQIEKKTEMKSIFFLNSFAVNIFSSSWIYRSINCRLKPVSSRCRQQKKIDFIQMKLTTQSTHHIFFSASITSIFRILCMTPYSCVLFVYGWMCSFLFLCLFIRPYSPCVLRALYSRSSLVCTSMVFLLAAFITIFL